MNNCRARKLSYVLHSQSLDSAEVMLKEWSSLAFLAPKISYSRCLVARSSRRHGRARSLARVASSQLPYFGGVIDKH
jgi:hypothetical protein